LAESGPFYQLNCLEKEELNRIVAQEKIGTIYQLAAVLSAVAEENPQRAWTVNMTCLQNALEVARQRGTQLFFPSSIAAFGPQTPLEMTPQDTIQRPTTIYGITKVAGELLCDYYFQKFGVDARGLRFPGLISYQTLPGGGTTDFAVDIYYKAVLGETYRCYLKPDTRLPMMYMPDAVRAMIELMEADAQKLEHRNAFNIHAISASPEDFAQAIRKVIPDFEIEYQVDPVRQKIAESWPRSLDDSAARKEWGWRSEYDLETLTQDMIRNLRKKLVPQQQTVK
jgi:nucleoside-diphosphate-sugar epimerase